MPDVGPIAAVVFDAVGTLIEPWPPVAEVYAAAARRQGIVLDVREVTIRFGRAVDEATADLQAEAWATDEAREAQWWRKIVAQVLPELPDPGRGFEELWTHFGQPAAWRCFADVAPALAALRAAGLARAVASNFDGRLHTVVRGLEPLAELGGALVISSEVGYRKPHPKFYQAVRDRLGQPAARILWVGDDPEHDLRAARRAGMRALWLDRAGHAPTKEQTITHLHALGKLILG
jgi:putative hydrolase of the HAD superfamily